jgi:sigma-70-like protein
MVPADAAARDELVRLAYLLGAVPPAASVDVAEFVRGWLADPGTEPDPLAERYGDAGQLRRGLDALAPRQRAAVVLRHWYGLPVTEAAELLECPDETVEQETDAALDVLATEEERLAADLAELAASAPVAAAEWASESRPARRWRSAGVAAGVLVAAGVFAGVLGLSEPAGGSASDPNLPRTWTPPPALDTAPGLVPYVPDAAPATDDRARRLTMQLIAAAPTVFPTGADLQTAVVMSPTGPVRWAPLVFHVSTDTPDLYLAMATVGSGHDAAVVKIDVGYRDPDAEPRFTPCPEWQQVCSYRRFADGTNGSVTVLDEPLSQQTIHRLTAMRPDGTFCHVTVFYKERRPDPPPLGVPAMFRFATAFRY